jgi:hypothetical protein
MKYPLLLEEKNMSEIPLPHFPTRFHAVVFRLWETLDAKRIASGLGVALDDVISAATAMGLPPQKNTDIWLSRGYITIIRNMWNILPYDQLLGILDMSEERLAAIIKEEDFLWAKLGKYKPICPRVEPCPLDEDQKKQLDLIKRTMLDHYSDLFSGARPFDFFSDVKLEVPVTDADADDGIRMIYSFCGLYINVLDEDISLSFPDALLSQYAKNGINTVWIPSALYQITPFPFDESYSIGWEKRQERLRELVEKCSRYGIKVFIYLNEPRCMPLEFFDKYPELYGRGDGLYGSLCMSDGRVEKHLYDSVHSLCENVRGLGGFFCINFSENLTHCKSLGGDECPRCKDVPAYELAARVVTAIRNAAKDVDESMKIVAWTWGYESYMKDREDQKRCISLMPKDVIIMSNSELLLKFSVAGFDGEVIDYSISKPGPSDISKELWSHAVSRGHDVAAKVAVNNSWECSTVPFLPVFDLIREHMSSLSKENVKHLMLSWTLGGYPSINLKIVSLALRDNSNEAYMELLREHFGEYADAVCRAAKLFSEGFKEFPFDVLTLYSGPHNPGPSNLIYAIPTGRKATMTCYSYDDLESWRSKYPVEVYLDQMRKIGDKWKEGLREIENMPECEFRDCAYAGYAILRSAYLQAQFVYNRDHGLMHENRSIVEEERDLAHLMYQIMQRNNSIGYEAANHYYYNRAMLIEKVLNCDSILGKYM